MIALQTGDVACLFLGDAGAMLGLQSAVLSRWDNSQPICQQGEKLKTACRSAGGPASVTASGVGNRAEVVNRAVLALVPCQEVGRPVSVVTRSADTVMPRPSARR